jgi:hypothetical protein
LPRISWFITDRTRSFTDSLRFGAPGDIPVPGDFDGINGFEVGVFRATTGWWFIDTLHNRTAGISQKMGLPGDIPLYYRAL